MELKNSFCTIVTKDYLAWSLSLYNSITVFDKNIVLNVLVTDIDSVEDIEIPYPTHVNIVTLKQLNSLEIVKKLQEKYNVAPNILRWSLKPAFIYYLLAKYEKIIYSDSDIYYFNNFQFLFEKLNGNNVLLTPHWRSKDPEIDNPNFKLLFSGGLFNGGFIAVNNKAKHVMQFWAKNCLEICELNLAKGNFADQTHLNLLPIYFDKVKILKHRGCNIANWNQVECKRTIDNNGNVVINDDFPIVFIHFTKSTIMGILKGYDTLLYPFLKKYNHSLVKYGFENLIEKYTNEIKNTKNQPRDKPWVKFKKRIKNKLKKLIKRA